MTNFWVLNGPGMPCGARLLREADLGPVRSGTQWLDICILGQHLPQMYAKEEIHELTVDECEKLGLCPDCFGFGDVSGDKIMSIPSAARGIDQISKPCVNCGGTGRAMLRVQVRRGPTGTMSRIAVIPHKYVTPFDMDPQLMALFGASPDMCFGCANTPDALGPRGETLHIEGEESELGTAGLGDGPATP